MDEMKVTNGDITLRVEVTGDGPTVLCVPGWPELAGSWHHQVEHLVVARVSSRCARRAWVRRQLGPDRGRALHAEGARRRRRCGRRRALRRADRAGRPRLGRTDRVEHRDPSSRSGAGGRRAERAAHAADPGCRCSTCSIRSTPIASSTCCTSPSPGVPEAAFGADMRAALKRVYFALSGDAPLNCWLPDAPRDVAFLPLLPDPPDGPLSFLSDAELDALAATPRAHRHDRCVQPLPGVGRSTRPRIGRHRRRDRRLSRRASSPVSAIR